MTTAATKARQQRQARRRDATRRELIDGARRVLLRDGLGGFTLDEVARECGITKQGLLYHFDGKDQLVFELYLEEWTAMANALAEAAAGAADGPAALEAIIRSYVAHYRGRLEMFRLVMFWVQQLDRGALSPERRARIRPLNELMYADAARKVARSGVPRGGDPRRLVFSAHLAAMGILTMKSLVERFDDPLKDSDAQLVDEMCRVFRAAIAKEVRE